MRRRLAAIVLTIGAALGLTACAPAEPIAVDSDTVIIDVRTPAEFAEGHLDGAINLDVQSAEFDALIAERPARCGGVDGGEATLLHGDFRIDNLMFGFTSLVNGGSLQQAADATGLEIVR